MLPGDAIVQPSDYFSHEGEIRTHDSRQEVQEFYDRIGWKKVDEKTYSDASQFEDLRAVSKDYISDCHRRVTRHIQRNGKSLLDAASGPIQYKRITLFTPTVTISGFVLTYRYWPSKKLRERLATRGSSFKQILPIFLLRRIA